MRTYPLTFLSSSDEKPFLLDGERFQLRERYHDARADPQFWPLIAERVVYALARYWYRRGRKDQRE